MYFMTAVIPAMPSKFIVPVSHRDIWVTVPGNSSVHAFSLYGRSSRNKPDLPNNSPYRRLNKYEYNESFVWDAISIPIKPCSCTFKTPSQPLFTCMRPKEFEGAAHQKVTAHFLDINYVVRSIMNCIHKEETSIKAFLRFSKLRVCLLQNPIS